MLVSIAVTVKQARILYFPDTLIEDFVFGNFLIFISYFIILKGVFKIVKKLPKIPKRVFIYLFWILFFVLYALYRKEFLIALDVFVYGLLISTIITSIEALHTTLKKDKNHVAIPLIIFALSLIIDFTLKSIVEIWHIPNLQTIKLASFIIRLVASLALLYGGRDIVLERSREMKIPVIHNTTLKFLKRIIISVTVFSISFSLFAFMSTYIFNYTKKGDLKDYTQSISINASQTATNIQSLIIKTRDELGTLAVSPDIIKLNEEGKEILKNYYLSHQNSIASVTRMDNHGTIIYTYPFTKSIGQDISSQPHVKKLLKTYTPVLSDPIMAVQGFPALALHVPVFENGVFKGSVVALFDLRKMQQFVNKKYKNEILVVANVHGTIISAPDENMLFKSISTVFPKKENDTFTVCRFGDGLIIKKSFFPIHNKVYTIYVFVPKSDVYQNITYRLLILLLLGGFFVISFVYAIRAFYNAFEEESEKLKEFAEIEYKESKTLSLKLSQLISLFSNVNINKNLEEASKEILNASLEIITNGNAGSILIKNGENFVYTAATGFTENLIGKAITDKEIVPSVGKKPFVIKHIYNEMKEKAREKFKAETKEILKKAGSKNIKSTLEAPIIVDNKYYGGIFIDSFKSEDAFTKDDLKIAGAISKLASIFIKLRLLINSLKETQNKLFYIMSNFAKLDISLGEEEFFKRILEIGKKLIPQADAGSATLKKGNAYKYAAIFGYREVLKKLKLDVKTSYRTESKTAKIVRDIATYNKAKLKPEHLEILSEAGASGIKQTIVAPVIVSGEYIGGIFLDTFKEGNVFSDSDIKTVTTLSKLASVFMEAHLTYQKLKKINAFNETSVILFHKLNIKSTKEDVLKIAYNILRLIYGRELQEVAVWEKTREKAILTKYDGKNISSLPLSTKSLEIALQKRGSYFTEGYNKNSRLAQVIVYSKFTNIPAFRLRFTGPHTFEKEEKAFIERFGREVINLYQSFAYYTQVKNTLTNYVFSIGNAVGAYNPYTEWHSIRVAHSSMHIAEKMNLNREKKATLLFAAVLHDVGKIGIPRDILLKKWKLTDEEFEIVKRHPIEGEKIVSPMNPEAAKIIRHHHERWDGTGYPDGLKDGEIPLLSRIITVVDVFDALTTNRPYRKAFSFEKAMEVMISERGKLFDPKILDIFLTLPKEILIKKEISKEDIKKMQQIIMEVY